MSIIEASSVGVRTMVDGTLRLTVDIEPRHSQAAFALFGAPGTPMALAALKPAQEQEKPLKEGPRRKLGPICEWLVMRCKEPAFQRWIRRPYDIAMGGNGSGCGDVTPKDFKGGAEGYARHAALILCEVESRKDIDGDEAAEERFERLIRKPWLAHQRAEEARA